VTAASGVHIEAISRADEPERTLYDVTVRGQVAPVQVVLDRRSGVTLWQRDKAEETLGRAEAAMLTRLLAAVHEGQSVSLPVDLQQWFRAWESRA
jgi:hypothetical protein